MAKLSRRRPRAVTLVAVVVTAALGPIGSASATYSSSTGTAHVATVPEAYELSGLVASPTHPNWYWTHSDVWKSADVFAACSGLSGAGLAECQQIQRARIWALRLDPVTHEVVEYRSFSLANPAWALDPVIGQNNDWEDIAVGPVRSDKASGNLVLAATGDAQANRVYDSSGKDITCHTRRLIELEEPNLADPTVATWTPWRIYDLKNWIGIGGLTSCNVESLAVSGDAHGAPTAYLVSKTNRKLLSRSLAESTGRDPATPPVAPDSTLSYRPAVEYVGALRDATGLRFTAADSTDVSVSLVVPKTSRKPCQILTWTLGSEGLGAALTSSSPVKSLVKCTSKAEGLAYGRDGNDPARATADLTLIADMQSSTRSTFDYWHLPDS